MKTVAHISLGVLMLLGASGCIPIMVGAAAGSAAAKDRDRERTGIEAGKREDACKQSHPDWPAMDCYRIARHELWIGMTREQVIAACGEPRKAYTHAPTAAETLVFANGVSVRLQHERVLDWRR